MSLVKVTLFSINTVQNKLKPKLKNTAIMSYNKLTYDLERKNITREKEMHS